MGFLDFCGAVWEGAKNVFNNVDVQPLKKLLSSTDEVAQEVSEKKTKKK